MPALDLMRSMMRGPPVDGYDIIKADKKEVYRDAYFSMKLIKVYSSSVLQGSSLGEQIVSILRLGHER